jgi:hypothetical protein
MVHIASPHGIIFAEFLFHASYPLSFLQPPWEIFTHCNHPKHEHEHHTKIINLDTAQLSAPSSATSVIDSLSIGSIRSIRTHKNIIVETREIASI